MKRSSGPRKTANLSQSVHYQLNMYTLAASTAGVAILALAQPASAKVIYTPANIHLGPTMNYNLDLNHDGMPDFNVSMYYTANTQNGTGTRFYDMFVRGLQKPNAAVVGNNGFARAFRPGITIGPKQVFGPATLGTFMAGCKIGPQSRTSKGPWLNVKNRYLGLRFMIHGKLHYGWARFTTTACPINATLTGYAYETITNKPILTGRTTGTDEVGTSVEVPRPSTLIVPTSSRSASLGLLALGSPALSIWRREESAVAAR
jgi:hypothetical protein